MSKKTTHRGKELTTESIKNKMLRFHNNKMYTFSINPDDTRQYERGTDRWAGVRRNVIEFLKPYIKYIKWFDLWPDISFPVNMVGGVYPRIHYHGGIEFKDIIGFLTEYDGRQHYSVEIDTIADEHIWVKYCKKFTKIHNNYKMYSIDYDTIDNIVNERVTLAGEPIPVNITTFYRDHKNTSKSSTKLVISDEEDDS